MKLKLPLIAAFVAILSLTACGGGGDDDSAGGNVSVSSPATLVKTDNTVGTGAEAVSGKTVTLNYTLWLYDASKSDHKGAQVQAGPYTYKMGTNAVIPGFEQGMTGMKVGGKRTIEIPSSLAYGVAGSPPLIPGNSGVVYEITLNSVQ